MRRLVAALALAAIALAGCSGGDDYADISKAPAGGAGATPETAPTEASATKQATVTYPDGLRVTLAGLEKMSRALGSETSTSQTLVRVALRFENVGTAPVSLDGFQPVSLYSGADRYETQQDAGFAYVDEAEAAAAPVLNSDDPKRVTPGSTVDVFRSFNVPTGELDDLAVEVHEGEHPPFTFTDAQALFSATPAAA